MRKFFVSNQTHFFLLAILLLGTVFRFYKLEEIPHFMNWDIGEKWLEVERIRRGDFFIYSPLGKGGRETLFLYLVAFLTNFKTLSYTSFKFVSALFSTATTIVIYFLVKELFGKKKIALLAAFFLAVGGWHTIIGRMGWRLSLAPFFVGLSSLFLAKAIKQGSKKYFVLGGFVTGLGFYSYPAFQFFLPLVFSLLLFWLIAERQAWFILKGKFPFKDRLCSVCLFLSSFLLVFLPLGTYIVEHPAFYWSTGISRIKVPEREGLIEILEVMGGNLKRTAMMFNFVGEGEKSSNVPGDPHLDRITGIFFILGIIYAVKNWRKFPYCFLLIGLFFLLLPSALSLVYPIEVPNSRRAIGATVFVYIFPGVSLSLFLERIGKFLQTSSLKHSVIAGTVFLLVLAVIFLNGKKIFVDYPEYLPLHNFPVQKVMIGLARNCGGQEHFYTPSIGYWHDAALVNFQLSSPFCYFRSYNPEEDNIERFLLERRGKFVFFLFPEHEERLKQWYLALPEGKIYEYRDEKRRLVMMRFEIER